MWIEQLRQRTFLTTSFSTNESGFTHCIISNQNTFDQFLTCTFIVHHFCFFTSFLQIEIRISCVATSDFSLWKILRTASVSSALVKTSAQWGKNPLLIQKFTCSKSHISRNWRFQNRIFHKNHIFKIALFNKITFSKTNFHKNCNFKISFFNIKFRGIYGQKMWFCPSMKRVRWSNLFTRLYSMISRVNYFKKLDFMYYGIVFYFCRKVVILGNFRREITILCLLLKKVFGPLTIYLM